MIRYTRKEVDVIRSKKKEYILPKNILDTIDAIIKEVGAPNYIKTPSFPNKKKKGRANEKLQASSNPNKRPPTSIETIQSILNKMSDKLYDKLKSQLIEIIEIKDTPIKDIVAKTYECVSNQAYNTALYARLYKDLIDSYPEFQIYCLEEYKIYFDKFKNIRHVNVEKDYETFCEINAMNAQVRTISAFYVELFHHDILEISHIIDLIKSLQQNLIEKGKEDTPDENPCIEYTENITILTLGCLDSLIKHEEWNSIHDDVMKIRKTDKTLHKNITNKIIFKHMDILDAINKIQS